MSRISKLTYIINMIEQNVFDGKALLESGSILEIVCGEISAKDLYLLRFKKLYDNFVHNKVSNWAFSNGVSSNPDVIYKNSFGEEVYLYKL